MSKTSGFSSRDRKLHRSKGSFQPTCPRRKFWPARLYFLGLVVGPFMLANDAVAGPRGGTVVGGSGSISQMGLNTVINQTSSKLAINWMSFNVASNESVLFKQPSFNSVALNRILDQNPSLIFGKITSNGQIFLINTSGIIFGASAQLNVGGLVASTLDLTPNNFLSSHYLLDADGGSAGIVNHGLIQAASGGSVSLIGGNVSNDGLIIADYGYINLDGADRAVLDFNGDGLIDVQVTGELEKRLNASAAAVDNSGTLRADGGTVVLQASAAENLFTNLVNNSGAIQANGVNGKGGLVQLVAQGGNTVESGTVTATGTQGGTIQLLSDHDVTVTGGTVDASGQNSGGDVSIGGGHGLLEAQRSYVANGVQVSADASASGSGGHIAVDSQNDTVIAGNLSAQGGVSGGNGGFIETSSGGGFAVTQTPNVAARSPAAAGGTWLIDPENVDIIAGSGNTNINAANPFAATGDSATLGVGLITAALHGGANVTVSTGATGSQNGDITLSAPLDYKGIAGNSTLVLNAAGNIQLNHSISDSVPSVTDVLNLTLTAGQNVTFAAPLTLSGNLSATAADGNVVQTSAAPLSVAGTTFLSSMGGATGVDVGEATNNFVGAVSGTSSSGFNISNGPPLILGSINAGDLTVNVIGNMACGGSTPVCDVTFTAPLTLSGNLSATAQDGSVVQTPAAPLSVSGTTFLSSFNGDVDVGEVPNTFIGAVSGSTGNGFSINNGTDLNLGSISANGLQVNVAGNITQSGSGALNLFGLSGSSTGSTTLTNPNNQLAGIFGFSANGLSVTNAGLISVQGVVTGGSSLTLTALPFLSSGNGTADIDIGARISATTVTLTSAGVINDSAGITATTLTGSAVDDANLGGPNMVANLGPFTAGGQQGLTFGDGETLAVTGPVSGGLGASLTTTAGDLAINGALSGTTTTLTSAGAITEGSGGAITAGTLESSSVNDTTLAGANLVSKLGFSSGANFDFNNAQALAVSGPLTTTGGTGNIQLSTTTGQLSISNALSGSNVDLTSATGLELTNNVTGTSGVELVANGGDITQDAGKLVTAGTLTGHSSGATTLNNANAIGVVGGFSASNFSLTDANALAVIGPVNGGASTSLTTTTGDLGINGALSGTTTTLTSAGAITEGNSGVITAGTLSGSSTTDTTLAGANMVSTLGGLSGAQVIFNNAEGLSVTGPVTTPSNAGAIQLSTTSGPLSVGTDLSGTTVVLDSAGDMTLANNITATTGTELSSSAGAISQTGSAGVITTPTLSGNSSGASTLDHANQIGALGNFSAAGLSLTDAEGLTVTGPVNGGATTSLTTTTGDLALNGAVDGTTTTLTSAGAITEGSGGVITAGTLDGSSANGTTLNNANLIGALGNFTAAGLSLTDAEGLTVTGPVNGGASTSLTTTTGDLAIDGGMSGTTTTLTSAGAITEGTGGVITADTLTGSSVNDTTLGGANRVTTLGSFSGKDVDFNNAQALSVGGPVTTTGGTGNIALSTNAGQLSIAGSLSGNTVDLTSATSLALANNVTGTTGVELIANGGGITESSGAVVTAGTLTGSSTGATTLSDANKIGMLGSFSAGGLSLTDAEGLTVTGPVNGGASTSLTTTTGDLALVGAVSGTTTTLNSAGAITEGTSGVVTTGTLNGDSTGATTLNGANMIGTLGNFSAAGLSLTDAQGLTVSGPVSGGASTSLTTTAGNLALNGALSGAATSLTSSAAITEGTGGAITAGTLTGSSVGGTTLGGANMVGTLSGFTAAGLSFTDAEGLTVTGPVNGGASASLTTTAGGLDINGPINGTTTTLASAGAITESPGGIVTAGTLDGSSVNATSLNNANMVGTLGSFSAAGLSLTDAEGLTVTGPVNGGASASLTTTTGDLAINGGVSGTTTTLTSAGAITEGTSGVITAGTLDGSSVNATTLGGGNMIGTLGNFSGAGLSLSDAEGLTVTGPVNGGASTGLTTTTGDLTLDGLVSGTTTTLTSAGGITEGTGGGITAGTLTGSSVNATALSNANTIGTLGNFSAAGFSLTDAEGLTVTGPVGGGASTSLTTTTGDLALNGAVNGTTTTLTSAGAITEGTGGIVTAGTLDGSSVNGTTLGGANMIGALGNFSAAGLSLTDAEGLTVTGPVNGGASTSLMTTTGDLDLNGAVNGTTTTLTSAGAITEGTGGVITAGTLTGSSVNGTTLDGANLIGALGNFSAAGLSLTDAEGLTVMGPVDGGASTGLTTTTGDLALNGAVSGTATTLTSAGAITEGTGGIVTAGTLDGSSVNATTLNNANMIGTLGNFSAAGLSLTDAEGLTVIGPVNGGASTNLTTSAGDLALNGPVNGTATTLTSAGAITEGTGGVITADTLTGSSVNGATLGGANMVGTLGNFSAAGLSLTDAEGLTVTGPVTGGASTSLTTTAGDLAVNGALSGTATTLTSAGAITEGTGGAITAGTLNGSSVNGTALDGANMVGSLGGFSASGLSLINAEALTVMGPVNGGASANLTTTAGDLDINGPLNATTTTLTSAGAITESTGGVITAGTLAGSSVNGTTLTNANLVGTLGSFSASGLSFTNGEALTVIGPVNGGPSASLTTTSGDLDINGPVNATTTTLSAAGAITESLGGVITTGTLDGSSVGGTTLNNANMIATLGNFSAAGLSLTDGEGLTVTGPVSGGASTGLTTTSGDLDINGPVSGTTTILTSAGAITESTGGVITAGTLSGSAQGPTTLGSLTNSFNNQIRTLGNFSSPAGFSLTDNQTLTLASVKGSTFTVNAGTSPLFLAVNGSLFQSGGTPLFDGTGTFSATGAIGSPTAPIVVIGTGIQDVLRVGSPPAFFDAVDAQGNPLPLEGAFSINLPVSTGAGQGQNGNHGDSFIDSSVISATYRLYGVVDPGVRLPDSVRNQCREQDRNDQGDCPSD